MKIVVTGGAGFIGSNVVDEYVREGHDVVVVDNLSSGKRENVNEKARFYHVDIRSDAFRDVFASERPDIVNHHAAQISVTASVEDPIYDADVNVLGLLNVLEAARINGTQKVIFISSGGAIYGEASEYPTSEAYHPQPLSPYAISKMVSEDYLRFYYHEYGLNYTVLRYANIYGPRQISKGEAGVVAIFMDNILAGKKSLLFHFENEPRGMTRDYCYVGDVVRANIAALEMGNRGIFNIGTGIATHTESLYKVIHEALAKNVPDISSASDLLDRAEARSGELSRSCLVVETAEKMLGWKALTDLESGIDNTVRWRVDRET